MPSVEAASEWDTHSFCCSAGRFLHSNKGHTWLSPVRHPLPSQNYRLPQYSHNNDGFCLGRRNFTEKESSEGKKKKNKQTNSKQTNQQPKKQTKRPSQSPVYRFLFDNLWDGISLMPYLTSFDFLRLCKAWKTDTELLKMNNKYKDMEKYFFFNLKTNNFSHFSLILFSFTSRMNSWQFPEKAARTKRRSAFPCLAVVFCIPKCTDIFFRNKVTLSARGDPLNHTFLKQSPLFLWSQSPTLQVKTNAKLFSQMNVKCVKKLTYNT